jgi:uncharacterized membrane protein
VRPLVPAGRVVGLDVARAVALVAMMATHILPDVRFGEVTPTFELAAGRASALFAVLAGVSVALMSGRTAPHRGRARVATSLGLAVRALLVAAVGVLLTGLGTSIAVILHYYGLLFLLALPFLGLGPRALAALAAGWAVVSPVVSHLVRPHLPAPTLGTPPFGDPLRLLAELGLTGYYPVVPWTAYLLAGMALGRLDLSRSRTALVTAAAGAWLAVTSALASAALVSRPEVRRALVTSYEGPASFLPLEVSLERGLYGTTPTGSWWWLVVDTPHTATPFDLAHTIGTSLLAIGVAVLLGRAVPRTLAVVAGAGTMTLTLYSAHVVSRTPGWWDGDGAGTFLAQTVAVLAVGAAYRLARRRGPLEGAVGRAQEAVRSAAAPRRRS